jgi:hypothetical protein
MLLPRRAQHSFFWTGLLIASAFLSLLSWSAYSSNAALFSNIRTAPSPLINHLAPPFTPAPPPAPDAEQTSAPVLFAPLAAPAIAADRAPLAHGLHAASQPTLTIISTALGLGPIQLAAIYTWLEYARAELVIVFVDRIEESQRAVDAAGFSSRVKILPTPLPVSPVSGKPKVGVLIMEGERHSGSQWLALFNSVRVSFGERPACPDEARRTSW